MPLNDTITGRNLIIQITGEVDHHRAKELMQEKHQKAFPLIFDKCITVIPSTKPMQER